MRAVRRSGQILWIVNGEAPPLARYRARRDVTPAIRREIVSRYERERTTYASVAAYAARESQRLALKGVILSPNAIAVLVRRHRQKGAPHYLWERLLDLLRRPNPRTRTFWYDAGDLASKLGIKSQAHVVMELVRLRERGYEVRRCRTSAADEDSRGWAWQYRLWEAASLSA